MLMLSTAFHAGPPPACPDGAGVKIAARSPVFSPCPASSEPDATDYEITWDMSWRPDLLAKNLFISLQS